MKRRRSSYHAVCNIGAKCTRRESGKNAHNRSVLQCLQQLQPEETRCGNLVPSWSACACRQIAEIVSNEWLTGMDGLPAMQARGWSRKVSGGQNSRSSISAIPPRADNLTSKEAHSVCGK